MSNLEKRSSTGEYDQERTEPDVHETEPFRGLRRIRGLGWTGVVLATPRVGEDGLAEVLKERHGSKPQSLVEDE